jgi:hypothetical protein
LSPAVLDLGLSPGVNCAVVSAIDITATVQTGATTGSVQVAAAGGTFTSSGVFTVTP